MSNTTRIADLPDNITMQQVPNQFQFNPQQHQQQHQQQQHQQQQQQVGVSTTSGPRNSVISAGIKQSMQQPSSQMDQSLSNTYMPMNIHPNPFGGSGQGDVPLPQNVHQSMDPYRNGTGQQQMQLPSRDIPMDSTNYTQDEAVQPNYIPPPPPSTEDYIKIYEESKNKKLKQHQEEKYRKETAEDLVVQFQTPVFVALLYFIFQMPVFNQLMYKYLSSLPIFRSDGNINLYGMILKSAGFAGIYYSMDKIVNYFKYL